METISTAIILICLIPFLATVIILTITIVKNKKTNETFSEVYSELNRSYNQLLKQQSALSTMYSELTAVNNELQLSHEKAKVKISKLNDQLKTQKKELQTARSSATKSMNKLEEAKEMIEAYSKKLQEKGIVLDKITEMEVEGNGQKNTFNQYHFLSHALAPTQAPSDPIKNLSPLDHCNCMKPVMGLSGRCKQCKRTIKK